jgi:glycosyltransferase involved in cell wall biosynthesis
VTSVLSVVIPVLNAERTLMRTLDSLRTQRLSAGWQQEVLVVDNGSTDGSLGIAERYPVRTLRCPTPGPAAARNQGIQHAKGDVIVFMDADVRPAREGYLTEVLGTFLRHPEIGAVGGPILPDPEGATAAGVAEHMVVFLYWHNRRKQGPAPIFQPTANLSVRRGAIETVGDFREDLQNLEDMEWCDRLRLSSRWALHFDPMAVVYHRTRSGVNEAMSHIYGYGLRHVEIFQQLRPSTRYLFQRRPHSFALNLPGLVLRRSRMVLGQWLRADPRGCVPLIPLILFFVGVWALGVVTGGQRYFSLLATAKPEKRNPGTAP